MSVMSAAAWPARRCLHSYRPERTGLEMHDAPALGERTVSGRVANTVRRHRLDPHVLFKQSLSLFNVPAIAVAEFECPAMTFVERAGQERGAVRAAKRVGRTSDVEPVRNAVLAYRTSGMADWTIEQVGAEMKTRSAMVNRVPH